MHTTSPLSAADPPAGCTTKCHKRPKVVIDPYGSPVLSSKRGCAIWLYCHFASQLYLCPNARSSAVLSYSLVRCSSSHRQEDCVWNYFWAPVQNVQIKYYQQLLSNNISYTMRLPISLKLKKEEKKKRRKKNEEEEEEDVCLYAKHKSLNDDRSDYIITCHPHPPTTCSTIMYTKQNWSNCSYWNYISCWPSMFMMMLFLNECLIVFFLQYPQKTLLSAREASCVISARVTFHLDVSIGGKRVITTQEL